MKTFYEMLQILESYHDDEKRAYEVVNNALKKAGIPWDEDEWKVLYGKWVDMTAYFHPGGEQRVQGVIEYEEATVDDYGIPKMSGFQINHKSFGPEAIEEIHSIRVVKSYREMEREMRDEIDYENTLRSLPY